MKKNTENKEIKLKSVMLTMMIFWQLSAEISENKKTSHIVVINL